MELLISLTQSFQYLIIPTIREMIKSCPGTISLGQGVVYYSLPPEAMEFLSKFFAEPGNNLSQALA